MASRNYSLIPPEGRPPQPPIPIRPLHRHHGWRIVGWIAGILVLLVVVVSIAAIVVVRSARFHDYVLRTVDTKASAALNTPVHLQNFALRLSTLSLDLVWPDGGRRRAGSEPAAVAG